MAEDLSGGSAVDLTTSVEIRGRDVRVQGSLVERVGRSAATPGDFALRLPFRLGNGLSIQIAENAGCGILIQGRPAFRLPVLRTPRRSEVT